MKGAAVRALMLTLLIPAGASAHQRLEVLGRPGERPVPVQGGSVHQRLEIFGSAVDLPAPVQKAPENGDKGEKCEPRSPWLTPTLATSTALQIADAHSTRRAVDAGAQEVNPLFRWAATSNARAYTTKAGIAAFFWWAADREACKHPRRALWITVALNVAYGLVVRNNYRVGTRLLEGR